MDRAPDLDVPAAVLLEEVARERRSTGWPVAMEGYFWRFTDPGTGRVVIALDGVDRGPDGHWATRWGWAAHPDGLLRTVAHPEGHASTTELGAFAGTAFQGTADSRGSTSARTRGWTSDHRPGPLAPTGDRWLQAEVTDESWVLRGRSAQWQIDVEGWGSLATAHVLPVPLPAEHRNVAGAIEHLGARMRVSVRRRGRLVWEDESSLAALEHGGIERARAEVVRRGGRPDEVAARPTT